MLITLTITDHTGDGFELHSVPPDKVPPEGAVAMLRFTADGSDFVWITAEQARSMIDQLHRFIIADQARRGVSEGI